MPLRWGFKAEAHRIARDVRMELALDASAPLDMRQLAKHLGIPAVGLRTLRKTEPEAVHQLTVVDSGAFSAVTLCDGSWRFIVYNDAHARTRQASDLAHELAHALLQHPPRAALDRFGCRDYPLDDEEEATWLGAALLVSEEAALSIVRRGVPIEEAAREYAVSSDMMRFRLNVTGARRRLRK